MKTAKEWHDDLLEKDNRSPYKFCCLATVKDIEAIQNDAAGEWRAVAESLKAAQPSVLSLAHKIKQLRDALQSIRAVMVYYADSPGPETKKICDEALEETA